MASLEKVYGDQQSATSLGPDKIRVKLKEVVEKEGTKVKSTIDAKIKKIHETNTHQSQPVTKRRWNPFSKKSDDEKNIEKFRKLKEKITKLEKDMAKTDDFKKIYDISSKMNTVIKSFEELNKLTREYEDFPSIDIKGQNFEGKRPNELDAWLSTFEFNKESSSKPYDFSAKATPIEKAMSDFYANCSGPMSDNLNERIRNISNKHQEDANFFQLNERVEVVRNKFQKLLEKKNKDLNKNKTFDLGSSFAKVEKELKELEDIYNIINNPENEIIKEGMKIIGELQNIFNTTQLPKNHYSTYVKNEILINSVFMINFHTSKPTIAEAEKMLKALPLLKKLKKDLDEVVSEYDEIKNVKDQFQKILQNSRQIAIKLPNQNDSNFLSLTEAKTKLRSDYQNLNSKQEHFYHKVYKDIASARSSSEFKRIKEQTLLFQKKNLSAFESLDKVCKSSIFTEEGDLKADKVFADLSKRFEEVVSWKQTKPSEKVACEKMSDFLEKRALTIHSEAKKNLQNYVTGIDGLAHILSDQEWEKWKRAEENYYNIFGENEEKQKAELMKALHSKLDQAKTPEESINAWNDYIQKVNSLSRKNKK